MSNRGENHHAAKLKADQVLEIRRRADQGETYGQLLKAFGVSRVMIHKIVRRKSWAHLPRENA